MKCFPNALVLNIWSSMLGWGFWELKGSWVSGFVSGLILWYICDLMALFGKWWQCWAVRPVAGSGSLSEPHAFEGCILSSTPSSLSVCFWLPQGKNFFSTVSCCHIEPHLRPIAMDSVNPRLRPPNLPWAIALNGSSQIFCHGKNKQPNG